MENRFAGWNKGRAGAASQIVALGQAGALFARCAATFSGTSLSPAVESQVRWARG
jgi:hypothetical protein